jgi:hypothetical protein
MRSIIVVLLFGLLLTEILICTSRVKALNLALVKIINPVTGDEWFNFTTNNKTIGDTFLVNVELFNVTNLISFQVRLTWNLTVLSYFSYNVPSNAVFPPPQFTGGPPPIDPPIDVSVPGQLIYGYAVGPQQPSFTGDGILFQIEFTIIISTGETLLHLDPYPSNDTFLIDNSLQDMQFTTVDGHHFLSQPALKGDVNSDGIVDMQDIYMTVIAFNSFLGKSNWNPHTDLNNDGIVNIRDTMIVILNFNEHV